MTGSGGSEYWLRIQLPVLPLRGGKKQSGWLSLNDRDHWARRMRLTAYYREAAKEGCKRVGLPHYQRVHVVAWMAYGSNRRLDPHNFILTAKAIIDGCVDYGLIPDDNSHCLLGPDMRRDERLPVGMHMQIIPL